MLIWDGSLSENARTFYPVGHVAPPSAGHDPSPSFRTPTLLPGVKPTSVDALARVAGIRAAMLDALPPLVLLDPHGVIVATNAPWRRLAAPPHFPLPWAGVGGGYHGPVFPAPAALLIRASRSGRTVP